MAVSRYSPDVTQGFNFEKDKNLVVGHINSLKIGDTTINPDFGLTDPENVSGTVKVVGVLSSVFWNGGYNDAVDTNSQVSINNRTLLATLAHSSLSNTQVEVELTVYEYDLIAKKYYKAFHTNGTKLKGLIEKQGGDLVFSIDDHPGGWVESPANYDLRLSVMPEDVEQVIHVAVSSTDKFSKRWGTDQG